MPRCSGPIRNNILTVEPGFRWIKNPAAISPVWLEKPERIAALAMLTVVGLLVYAVIQRQVRLYLRDHDRQIPGNKGPTADAHGGRGVCPLYAGDARTLRRGQCARPPSPWRPGLSSASSVMRWVLTMTWYQGAPAGQNSLLLTTPP